MTSPEMAVTVGTLHEDFAPDSDELVAEDLIEEVSIDGMCGVY